MSESGLDNSQSNSAGGGLRQWANANPTLVAQIGAGVIVLATLLAYIPAMRSDFIWDDDYHVSHNLLLRNWSGLQQIWTGILPDPSRYPLPQYYPMTHTTFWIEYRLWGANPAGYHAVNVILHSANALLIFLILRRLAVPGGWLAAAVFAVHPLNVESVAWISERKNVLSLLFFLSSLYVYLRYAGIIKGKDGPKSVRPVATDSDQQSATQIEWFTLPDDRQRLYALAGVLFLCALLSKTITCSMPAVALLIIWWKRGRLTLSDFKPLAPMVVVGAAMGLLTAHLERVHVGVAQRPQDWDFAPTLIGEFGARSIIAGKAIWFYVLKLLFPRELSFNYSPRWTIDASNIAAYLFPLTVVVAVTALALYRKRIGTGPLVAVLYFIGTLFPALGFVNVWPMRYSFVADHFVYLSSIGLIALAAAIAVRYVPTEILSGIAIVVLVTLLRMSQLHQDIFKDQETLWAETWKQSHNTSWMAANNYGSLLLLRERPNLDAAEMWFHAVGRIKPDHPESRLQLAKIAIERGRRAERFRAYVARATSLPSTLPATVPTTQDVANFYEQAIDYYNQALQIQPNFVDAHFELGQFLVSLDRVEPAKRQFRKVVELFPDHPVAHLELGTLALREGDMGTAITHFLRGAEINPQSAYAQAQLGTALLQMGRLVEGLTAWDEALRLAPDNPRWPTEFGARMADAGQYPKAVEYLRRALRIDPKNLEAMTNLGVVAAKTGYPEQAEELFKRALEIDPGFEKAKLNLDALKSGRLRPATTRSSTRPAAQVPTTR